MLPRGRDTVASVLAAHATRTPFPVTQQPDDAALRARTRVETAPKATTAQ